jgi:hypothetical protein
MSAGTDKDTILPNGSAAMGDNQALTVRSKSESSSKPKDGQILTGKQEHCTLGRILHSYHQEQY